jgi:glycosyltransferase EpsD
MKIIFICTKSITFNTFLKSQANYLKKKGIEVEVACSDIENIDSQNYTLHKINFPNQIKNFFNFLNYIIIFFQIRKLTKNNSSTVFYLHTPVASHLFRLFTYFKKIKIVYFVHGFRFSLKSKSLKNYFFRTIEKVLSFNSNIFITINNDDFNYVKYNFGNKNLCYKVNGVGLSFTSKHFKKKIKNKKKIRKIIVIGAYKKNKGYLEILKVAEILKANNISITCFGYGDYENYNSIKIKKNLNKIFFNPFDNNLKKKIKNFDLLLHLSKREGLPVSVMECLAQGLPVICYNIRGNNDLIKNGFNGYFIDTYKDAPNKIYYLNLENDIYNKMRSNASKSINKDFLEKEINLKIYQIIIKNFKNTL